MLIYIVLLIFILACGLIPYKYNNKKKSRKWFLALSFGAMTLVLGLRSAKVGEDTQHYLNMFMYSDRISWSTMLKSKNMRTVWYIDQWGFHDTVENGWLALCKIVHIFTDNGQIFLFIVSTLTCVFFAKFIYDNTERVVYATLIFLCESMFMFSFNGARQMLAVALTLPVYSLLKQKKVARAVIWVIIASLIHNIALVTFVVFPFVLTKQKNDFKKFKYAIILAVVSPFIIMALQNVIIAIFPRYTKYFTTNYWTNTIGGSSILWIIEIALVLLMYRKKFKYDNSFQYACLILIYLSCELMSLRVTMFSRVGYFFRAYLLLFYPNAELYISKRNRLLARGIIIALLVLLYVSYARNEWRTYSFFWQ